jgi:hypothetical protein
MSRHALTAEQRAATLVRCYPRTWRDRYGEEFAELLVAEIEERPRSLRWTADVVRAGLVQRGAALGIATGPAVQPESALAATGCAFVVLGLLGLSIWTQLASGMHTAPSGNRAAAAGAAIFPLTAGYFALLALATIGPLVVAAARCVRRVTGPAVLAAAGASVLAVGGHHFASARPGAGGVAAYGWAETLGISTYWVHPTRILALRPEMIGWMGLSLIAVAALAGGATTAVRRLELSPTALRYVLRLAQAAVLGVLPAVAVSAGWVLSSQASWDAGLRAGSLDVLLLAVMTVAVAIAASSIRSGARAAAAR